MAEYYSDDKEYFNFDCFLSDEDLFAKDDLVNLTDGKSNEYKYEMRELHLEDITSINVTKDRRIYKDGAKCDSVKCMLGNLKRLSLYLCYVCNEYLCIECLRTHDKSHEFVRVQSDSCERKSSAEALLEKMRNERFRERNLNTEDIRLYGRMNVKHEFDIVDCVITTLCGLQNKKWVVLDNKYSMKIFSSVTNVLLKYVRFGSFPRDATEINIEQTTSETDSASGSQSRKSKATRIESDKHLLAVTFPYIKQIWFIDVDKTPAIKTKSIEMQIGCWFIDFSDDKIFAFCMEEYGSGYRYSVFVLSSKGDYLKKIQCHSLFALIPDLNFAVSKGKVFVTDYYKNKIFTLNVKDGSIGSKLIIEGSGPKGICVDPSNNIYVCGEKHNNVYKLSQDLQHCEPVGLNTVFTPYKLCFTDDKLFISHRSDSSPHNFVTIVQLT